jgi:transcriptional regulator with XRE-family HTH domain
MNLDPNSSPLAFFVSEVKRLRANAGMTREDLSGTTHYAPSTIAALETCRLIPSEDLAKALDSAFGTDGHFERLQGLVEESVLPWFRDRVKIERKASEIRVYESYVIPGLLQTENYARCSISGRRPPLSTDEITAPSLCA